MYCERCQCYHNGDKSLWRCTIDDKIAKEMADDLCQMIDAEIIADLRQLVKDQKYDAYEEAMKAVTTKKSR